MQRSDSDLIYLDGFATMPLATEAMDAMQNAWQLGGNAGSGHLAGARAAAQVAQGRAAVARLIGAAPSEIVFTSGATEANNLALLGIAANAPTGRRRILIASIEHKSVLAPTELLEKRGFRIERIPVDRTGAIDIASLGAMLDEEVLLVSVMAANNETGVIQPVAQVAALAHAMGTLMHCDAAQAVGKIPVDVVDWDVDLLSISAHKCYGPMGIGALYIAAGTVAPVPLLMGGGQQGGLRAGTEPVALIAGFGAAADVAYDRLAQDAEHGHAMVARLLAALAARQVRYATITGDHAVLPGSVALQLAGIDAESLCMAVGQQLCLSTGSACTHGQLRTSHVLEEMGFSDEHARQVIRIFCPRNTSPAMIDRAADTIAAAVVKQQKPLDGVASGRYS